MPDLLDSGYHGPAPRLVADLDVVPALAYRTKIGTSRVNIPKSSWTRSRLAPMLFEALAGYRRRDFVADLMAGIAAASSACRCRWRSPH